MRSSKEQKPGRRLWAWKGSELGSGAAGWVSREEVSGWAAGAECVQRLGPQLGRSVLWRAPSPSCVSTHSLAAGDRGGGGAGKNLNTGPISGWQGAGKLGVWHQLCD